MARLGLREGASENAVVALALLESLVERGLDPGRARLFVLDGSKALHKAVGQVFGSACLVQRCRNHKMRNVTGHLPKELHDQASAVLRAAWKLGAKDGKARIEQFASWVEKQHPDAAGSLREGPPRELTPALRRCRLRSHPCAAQWRASPPSRRTTAITSRRTWTSSALPRLTERRFA